MESKQAIIEELDPEKIMDMTREEVINLLGDENANRVNEGLKNGTLSYREFDKICKESFSIIQQATFVRNVIFIKLSKSECFNMFESNKEKQRQYAEIEKFREKAENGELTQEDLKYLCDQVFGKNSDLSKRMQRELIARGKVKTSNTPQMNTERNNSDLERD